jgi:hypothetical protein
MDTTMCPIGIDAGKIADVTHYRLVHPDQIFLSTFAMIEEGTRVHSMRGDKKRLIERAGKVASVAAAALPGGIANLAGGLIVYCAGCMLAVDDQMPEVANTVAASFQAFVATGLFQSQILPLLREIGIGVSIDDFGTGYSSLSTLADITAGELKIDRSFITSIHQRPRSQSILMAIESLSDALGMCFLADGIETNEENEYIKDHTNIIVGQGYLFHKPQFVEQLIEQAETSRKVSAKPARSPA